MMTGSTPSGRSGGFLERYGHLVAPDPNSGCWLWIGTWDFPSGGQRPGSTVYGRIEYKGRQTRPHRVAYDMERHEIPRGLVVRHKCDVSMCVNPDHLEIGTHQDNINDMIERGRMHGDPVPIPKGPKNPLLAAEANGRAKLSQGQVDEIRARRAFGESCQAIASDFGVTKSYVSKVARRIRWLDTERSEGQHINPTGGE